jgi:hypothetical protein
VLSAPVVQKLDFINRLIRRAGRGVQNSEQ